MRFIYLYKCADCDVVKSIKCDYGKITWNVFCRVCYTTTEHCRIMVCGVDNEEERKID